VPVLKSGSNWFSFPFGVPVGDGRQLEQRNHEQEPIGKPNPEREPATGTSNISNQNSSLFSIRDIPASALHLNVPEVRYMLETLIVVLVVLWLLGMVSSYTIGGLIHLLLVLAVIVLIVRLLQGRRVV